MKKSRQPRSTKDQLRIRTLRVYELLVQGVTRQDIIKRMQDIKVSDRQVDHYIHLAGKMIKEDLVKDKSIIMGTVLNKQSELYRLAVEKGDLETARKVLADFTKLNDLDNPQKIDIQSKNTNINKNVEKADTGTLLSIVNKKK